MSSSTTHRALEAAIVLVTAVLVVAFALAILAWHPSRHSGGSAHWRNAPALIANLKCPAPVATI